VTQRLATVTSLIGLLEKDGESTAVGRRGYHRMPDVDGVERALAELEKAT